MNYFFRLTKLVKLLYISWFLITTEEQIQDRNTKNIHIQIKPPLLWKEHNTNSILSI